MESRKLLVQVGKTHQRAQQDLGLHPGGLLPHTHRDTHTDTHAHTHTQGRNGTQQCEPSDHHYHITVQPWTNTGGIKVLKQTVNLNHPTVSVRLDVETGFHV